MPWEPTSTATLTDPGSLRDRDGVTVETAARDLDPDDVEAATDWDSHVAVGVTGDPGGTSDTDSTGDRGVLLQNDGHHGWTLPAFAVAAGDDWLAVARREFESLTGAPVEIDAVEHAQRTAFRPPTDEAIVVWNVVVSATPADDSLSADPESRDDDVELDWFDDVPEDADGPVADDVERVLY